MNLKDLLFGRLKASTEASTTIKPTVLITEASFSVVSLTTIMLLIVSAVSFLLGIFFWALVVICKRRRRSRIATLQNEVEMLERIVHMEKLEDNLEQISQRQLQTSVDQPQQVATTTVDQLQQAEAPSNNSNQLRKITINQTVPVPTHLKRQSKVPVKYGGG